MGDWVDWIKARVWSSSWRQQVKKAVVTIAVLVAAGALYLEFKRDYGFKDHIINAELQRDYSGGALLNDAEMLRDYRNVARVYQIDSADTVQRDDNAGEFNGVYNPSNTSTSNSDSKEDIGIKAPRKSHFFDSKENVVGGRDGNKMNAARTRAGLDVDHGNAHEVKHGNTNESSTSLEFSMAPSSAVSRGNLRGNFDEITAPPMTASSPSPTLSFVKVKNQYIHGTGEASVELNLPTTSINLSTGKNGIILVSDSLKDAKDTTPSAAASPPRPPLAYNTSAYHADTNSTSTHEENATIAVSSNSEMNEKNSLTNYGLFRTAPVDSREPHSPTSKSKVPLWPLSKLELDLYAAKEAIQNNPVSNSSSYRELLAPIYLNLSQFIKSYEMMEKMFRVYVYKEGRGPLVHTGPVLGIYSSEGLFIRLMEESKQFCTEVAEEALALFLPYSVANMVDELYVPHSTSMLPLSSFIKSYVNEVAARHPFWNRTKGGDHFFVSCHDWGLMTSYEHDELRHNAIKVLCNADETTEFQRGRDMSLPEFYMHATGKLGEAGTEEEGMWRRGRQQRQRETLAFFAGQMHGRVRPKLLKYWEYPKGGQEMQVYGVLPAVEARRMSYKQRMRTSRYCLCPMGYEVNSPRVVEAIEAMCVPVIIADGFVLPFSDVLDWSSFSISVAEEDIPSLKSILQGTSEETYMTMRRRLPYVRRHFTWHQNPQPFDTFHMILHSVWTSRLTNITSLQI